MMVHFNYRTEPYAHQREALDRSYDKRNYAYFMEMGCGKSKVLIDNVVWLYEQGRIDTAIIVAPKGVYRNWETSEIPTHFPTNIPHEIYVWNPSPNKVTSRASQVWRSRAWCPPHPTGKRGRVRNKKAARIYGCVHTGQQFPTCC